MPRPKRSGGPPRPLPRVLSPGEARKLLAAAVSPKWRAIFAIGLYTGLRAAEITSLRVSDIDTEQMILHVRKGKGGKAARVPLPPRLLPYIAPFLGRSPNLPLIPGQREDKPYCTRALRYAVRTAAARAGLPGHVHVHTLRHTFGTEVQRRGRDLARTQRLMRHEDVQTTMIYVHLAIDDVRPLADDLDFDPSTS